MTVAVLSPKTCAVNAVRTSFDGRDLELSQNGSRGTRNEPQAGKLRENSRNLLREKTQVQRSGADTQTPMEMNALSELCHAVANLLSASKRVLFI
ncbi:MAG: hypothetical protein ACPHRO_12615, partial [Nannocystaceae bacterium]